MSNESRSGMIVHGGAWDIPPDKREAHRDGCVAALRVGLEILDGGGDALDAVEQAVRQLEDDETFDAGRGSFLNSDGIVEMDAGIMDGTSVDVGAVAGVKGIRNPITLARRVLESEQVLLIGDGATRFARATGVEECGDDWLVTPSMRALWDSTGGQVAPAADFFAVPRGTVGAVARDNNGRLAAATSTGGAPGTPPGRVGDSPIPGAGYYADDKLAAVSATGWGEGFLRLLICFRATSAAAAKPAQAACNEGIAALGRLRGRGGLIMVDRSGRIGVSYNTSAMAFAYRDEDGSIRSGP